MVWNRGRKNLPSTNTGVGASEAKLLTDLSQTGDGTLTRSTGGLVDLGQHGVSGLRDDGSSETSNQTGAQVDGGLGAVRERLLVDALVDHLRDLLEDDELGHGVGDPASVLVFWTTCNKKKWQKGKTYCLNSMGPKPE